VTAKLLHQLITMPIFDEIGFDVENRATLMSKLMTAGTVWLSAFKLFPEGVVRTVVETLAALMVPLCVLVVHQATKKDDDDDDEEVHRGSNGLRISLVDQIANL
jgi:hypothetical protein